VAGRAAGAGAIEHAPTDLVAAGGDVLAIVASGEFADPYVTKVGRDPTWATGAPKEVVRITDFALRTPQSRTGLSIAERDGARVAVAGHEVGWDDDRKLWYCDIELDPGPSYFPFVRLALARFQPESIAGAHLSPIVLTDFMQLTADRTAGLVRRSGQAVVTVTGLGPHNIVAEKVHPGPLGPTAPATNLSRTVTAVVQERDPSLPTDMGWSDVGKEQTLAVVGRRRGPERTWRGSLPLPDDLDTGTYRLLIREYESFFTDWDPEEHPPFSTTVPGTPVGFTRSRIVYADAFDLGP
jgi:hypothetical protein